MRPISLVDQHGKSSRPTWAWLVLFSMLTASGAFAGPWEDGMVVYNRGDYAPAIRLFRPFAESGDKRAQKLLAEMYHKIHHKTDPARNAMRAYMWYDIAASEGDAEAETGRDQVSRDMSAQQIQDAHEMAQRCLASHYAQCK
jgi:TPR repeat protein